MNWKSFSLIANYTTNGSFKCSHYKTGHYHATGSFNRFIIFIIIH